MAALPPDAVAAGGCCCCCCSSAGAAVPAGACELLAGKAARQAAGAATAGRDSAVAAGRPPLSAWAAPGSTSVGCGGACKWPPAPAIDTAATAKQQHDSCHLPCLLFAIYSMLHPAALDSIAQKCHDCHRGNSSRHMPMQPGAACVTV